MKWLLLVLTLVLSLSAFAGDVIDSDSGIKGPKYSEILNTMDSWKAEHPSLVSVEEYGKSVQGRPLKMVIVGKKRFRSNQARPTLIMSGSTHGNEYLNLEDRIPEALLNEAETMGSVRNYIEQGGMFLFIPIMNPDGYDARQRENAHGVDLNRDWDVKAAHFKGFKEVETRALVSKYAELKSRLRLKFNVTVDYHCCAGAILYPWSYTDNSIPVDDLEKHKALGKMADSHLQIEYGTTGQILGYHATGTTKDYYYESHGALSFTYEGRYGKEDKLFDQHLEWWRDMIDFVSQEDLLKKLLVFAYLKNS